jgi:2-polyprenyl-3-methyl-5-hydroxy-6-metoxy-1,4-benzoquinol methylase
MDTNEIRTKSQLLCPFCNSAGHKIYADLEDKFFNAPGRWNLFKCERTACGVVWLNPLPLEEDIIKAYTEYYTHTSGGGTANSILKKLFKRIQVSYWVNKYGYKKKSSLIDKIISLPLYLHPLKKSESDLLVLYLKNIPGGKLLDIGCGDGKELLFMKKLGWDVEGIDFDQESIKIARMKGIKVSSNTLARQSYKDNYFDAVIMKHVFEHIYSPIEMLEEIQRILKPGGSLVIITPNNNSISHKIFRRNWRGLEPPRHLHIMNRKSLRIIIENIGFVIRKSKCYVTSAYVIKNSYLVSVSKRKDRRLNFFEKIFIDFITILYAFLTFFINDVGDNVCIIAKKI